MRFQYIFHGQNKEPHPFHVKSNWMPPVQQSIALESYLESVKTQLADIRINKPKNNLSRNEMAALKELKNNSAINLKKADKGTTERILPFVTTYHPAVKKLKQIVMENWRFIENKPMLKTIF